jgi:hypothetical protein
MNISEIDDILSRCDIHEIEYLSESIAIQASENEYNLCPPGFLALLMAAFSTGLDAIESVNYAHEGMKLLADRNHRERMKNEEMYRLQQRKTVVRFPQKGEKG